jgi:hypothetical protein
MSRFGWGERVVYKKKTNYFAIIKPFDKTVVVRMAE